MSLQIRLSAAFDPLWRCPPPLPGGETNQHDRLPESAVERGARKAGSVLATGLLLVFTATTRADVKVGDAFPELAAAGVVNLAGGDMRATAGKVVLVDFWASWCAPCRASFPAMAKLHADYAPRGLYIAAVSIDEKLAAATNFVTKLAPPFATLHDRAQGLVKQVVVPTMPTCYLVDRTGKVRFIHEGFHGDATAKEIRKEIETLLAEKS